MSCKFDSSSLRSLSNVLLRNRLLSSSSLRRTPYSVEVAEIFPVSIGIDQNQCTRLCLLVPTLEPEKIYGGISTALKFFKDLSDSLESPHNLRFIVTTDNVSPSALHALSQRFKKSAVLCPPSSSIDVGIEVVPLLQFRGETLIVRSSDYFVATAWWTADLGFRLINFQERAFKQSRKLIYLIQDWEPGFYKWSDKYAAAEATYLNGDKTIAVINSEELFGYFNSRYQFEHTEVLRFELNQTLSSRMSKTRKEKNILVYGRPSVERNCFYTIIEGLRIWQAQNPSRTEEYTIEFVGEFFSDEEVKELINSNILGKLSLEEYAERLNKSEIGISMMLSPHPSYPPLEMASAGMKVITNKFEAKDLQLRSDNIYNVDLLTPRHLAKKLNEVMNASKFDDCELKHVEIRGAELNVNRVLDCLFK